MRLIGFQRSPALSGSRAEQRPRVGALDLICGSLDRWRLSGLPGSVTLSSGRRRAFTLSCVRVGRGTTSSRDAHVSCATTRGGLCAIVVRAGTRVEACEGYVRVTRVMTRMT